MSTASRARCLWLSILAILVAGVFVYSNSLDSPFVYDDKVTIQDSLNVRGLPDVLLASGAPDGSCASGRPVA